MWSVLERKIPLEDLEAYFRGTETKRPRTIGSSFALTITFVMVVRLQTSKLPDTAFADFGCERQEIVSQGDFVGCRTTMFGRFEQPITMPPLGEIQPNGAEVSFQLVNMFR